MDRNTERAGMTTDLALRILVMTPLSYLGFMLYVYFLLVIARKFSGILKGIIASLLYGLFAVVVVLPLIYLLNVYHPQISHGNNILLFGVIAGYFLVVAPGSYYLFRHLGPLRDAGYFGASR